MSKNLDKVIKEMNDYGNMGGADCGSTMGSVAPIGGLRGSTFHNKIKAYKLNDFLRKAQRTQEDTDGPVDDHNMEPMDTDVDDMDRAGEGAYDLDSMKAFFVANPEPSDDEIHQYASDNNMDLQGMRKAFYALVASLIAQNDEMPADDHDHDVVDNMPLDDDFDFSVRGDTGERPATNEYDDIHRGR